MAICVRFSHLLYTYYVTFSLLKKPTLNSTWEVIRLIDSYINTREFRYVPLNCCVKNIIDIGCLFQEIYSIFTQKVIPLKTSFKV